jgi:23S rRNA pseudouridine955/2504/2580 synthase
MFLHARRLTFQHPATGEMVTCEAPLPAACALVLDRQA